MATLPRYVCIVESSPHDGPGAEAVLALDHHVELNERLVRAGLADLEVGGFAPGTRTGELLARLPRQPGVRLPAHVGDPGEMESALAAQVDEITVTVASTDRAARHAWGCRRDLRLERLEPVARLAEQHGVRLRGVITGAVACPFDGPVSPRACAELCGELRNLGCFEVSLADTTSAGQPAAVRRLWDDCADRIGPDRLAARFHDRRGGALANLATLLPHGLQTIDAALDGGPGADRPAATAQVVRLLASLGIATGIDSDQLAETAWWLSAHTRRAGGVTMAGPTRASFRR